MTALIRKNFNLLSRGKILLLFCGCLLFSLAGRTGTSLSFEQHILCAVSDHYYVLYFMLPITLFTLFTFLEDDSEIVIGRFRSYAGYFLAKWGSMGVITVCLVTVQTTAVLLSGIGCSIQNDWRLPSGALAFELFEKLRVYFISPRVAFLILTGYQWLGSWLIAGILMWICHFMKSRMTLYITMLLYVFSVLWIKVPVLRLFPIAGFNHFMILHHNLTSPYRLLLTVVTGVLLTGILILTVKYCWRSRGITLPKKWRGLTPYYLRTIFLLKNLIIIGVVIAGMTMYKSLENSGIISADEWVNNLFSGHGCGYFHPLSFLEMLIVNGVPLYLLSSFIEKTINDQSLFIPIRVKSRTRLMKSSLLAGFVFLAVYGLLWGVAAVFAGYVQGSIFDTGTMFYLLEVVLLKLLDCFFQYLVVMVLYCCTKQVTVGFVVLVAGNMLCMLPEYISRFLPFGASSVARFYGVTGNAVSVGLTIGYFAVLSLPVAAWLMLIGKRKQFI